MIVRHAMRAHPRCGSGSFTSAVLLCSVRPYATYSVLDPAYFQHLVFNSNTAVAVVDSGGFHTFASPAYCDLFNIATLSGPVGINLTQVVVPGDVERLQL